jgi:hypothetical protein
MRALISSALARSCVIVLRMSMVEQVAADLSHGARWLRRHPRFAALSTLIIAIGVGGWA